MADGVRIQALDPALRGAVLDIPHPTRITAHNGQPKMYRVQLDGEGAATVSETVWARIREIMSLKPASTPQFIEVGLNKRPPTIRAGGGDMELRPVFKADHDAGLLVPAGVQIVPKVTLKD